MVAGDNGDREDFGLDTDTDIGNAKRVLPWGEIPWQARHEHAGAAALLGLTGKPPYSTWSRNIQVSFPRLYPMPWLIPSIPSLPLPEVFTICAAAQIAHWCDAPIHRSQALSKEC